VARATQRQTLLGITIEGELITVDHGDSRWSDDEPYGDEGGER
jgi:hypothetical protein